MASPFELINSKLENVFQNNKAAKEEVMVMHTAPKPHGLILQPRPTTCQLLILQQVNYSLCVSVSSSVNL